MMIKLLIDYQTFILQSYGGISRYFANIHHAAQAREDIESRVGLLYTRNYYLKDYPSPLNNAFGQCLMKKQSRYHSWNKAYSRHLISKNDYTVLHPSYYNPYYIKYAKKPVVITVHDMIHERLAEYFDPGDFYVRFKRLCIENAAHIIAISETTKRDLQEILQVEESRITVVHHGYQMSPDLAGQHEEVNVRKLDSNYLLFVGDRKGYKNFPIFLTAVSELLKTDQTLKLICAGGGLFREAEQEMLMRLKVKDKVIQVSPTDNELKSLYQHAIAFIFPSLYEGFGLPILESFKNNCPVIASNNACFKEIGEDAIAYFDPHDQHSIAATIKEVMTNEPFKEKLISNGRKQLEKFSMELCMEKTMAVYRKVSG